MMTKFVQRTLGAIAAAALLIISSTANASTFLFKLDEFSDFEPFAVGETRNGITNDPKQGFEFELNDAIWGANAPTATILVEEVKEEELIAGILTIDLSGLTPFYTPTSLSMKAGTGTKDISGWSSLGNGLFTIRFDSSIDLGNKGVSNLQVHGELAPVPLPAAAWLFGSALLGMAGIGIRRSRKT